MSLAQRLIAESVRVAAPPKRLTVSEWADTYRYLSAGISAEPGRWRTDRAEYQRGILDAFNDPAIHTVVVMSSSQVGKSEMLLNWIGYYIHQDPSPIMLLQPRVDDAKDFSKNRVAPMLRDTPVLRDKVKDPKSRASGNTLLLKEFDGGYLYFAGANSPAGLAARPIRIVLADEVDRYPDSAGAEGDPVNLAFKRTTTFWNRKHAMVSTPTIKGASRIERAFLEGDQRRFHVPCPHCGHMHVLIWDNVVFDKSAPHEARLACPACGGLFDNVQRLRAIRKGEWRATAEGRPGVASFHLSELYSPWKSIGEVAADFIEAEKHPETLKTWINTSLGETWEERGDAADADDLLTRRENYTPAALPDDILVLTAGVDVQDDRLEAEIVGWGLSDEAWGIEYVTLNGDPAREDVWQRLDTLLLRTWRTESGRALKVRAACIDTGGHHTQRVYQFCAERSGRNVWAIAGRGGASRPIWPPRASKSRVHKGYSVRIIGVDTAKDKVHACLRVKTPGPAYWHFPVSYDERYFRMLTAEKRITTIDKAGRPVRKWVLPSGQRNEALDCRVYALAAWEGLQAEQFINPHHLKIRIQAGETERSTSERKIVCGRRFGQG